MSFSLNVNTLYLIRHILRALLITLINRGYYINNFKNYFYWLYQYIHALKIINVKGTM